MIVSLVALLTLDGVYFNGRYSTSITASARQLDANVEQQVDHLLHFLPKAK
jgi:hypothetical protein